MTLRHPSSSANAWVQYSITFWMARMRRRYVMDQVTTNQLADAAYWRQNYVITINWSTACKSVRTSSERTSSENNVKRSLILWWKDQMPFFILTPCIVHIYCFLHNGNKARYVIIDTILLFLNVSTSMGPITSDHTFCWWALKSECMGSYCKRTTFFTFWTFEFFKP